MRAAVLSEQDLRFARQLVHFRKPRADQLLIGVDPGKGKANTRVLDRTLAYLLRAIYQRYRAKVIVLARYRIRSLGVTRSLNRPLTTTLMVGGTWMFLASVS